MDEKPSGRVAFLFTDLEGSTRYWERAPEAMPDVYARHDAILRSSVERQNGVVYKVIGDAFQIAFPSAGGALSAAVEAQLRLLSEPWPVSPAPRVRMALHIVEVAPTSDGDYRTPGLNRLGRLLSAADGAEILLTEPLVRELPNTRAQGVEIVDLGVQQFRDLSPQRVYQAIAAGLPTELAALRALVPHRHNLPQPATTFIGRLDEIERGVNALLDPALRVLTLIGPGGIGKTRLAIEMASRVVDQFAGGVWFIPLASVTEPDLVLAEIAGTLGVRESLGETVAEALAAHLSTQEILLVLDNLEQVIAAAPQLASLIAQCPGMTMLTTSRMPLQISGEREMPLQPLPLPNAVAPGPNSIDFALAIENEAIRLFVERTRAVVPSFVATSENIGAIAAICERLDGLPLAIELAAARGRLLPPAKLLERLQTRLPLLTGGPRDTPARQQTLRATIDWSHELLTPEEKRLFAQLAVFANGASLEAVEAVCSGETPNGEIFDSHESLVRQSLLHHDAEAGLARVQMLGTIREYALERLNQSDAASEAFRRHAAYFGDLAEAAEPQLSGPDQADWLDLLALEHDNVRAALTHLETTDQFADLIRMTGALWRFWWIRGHLSEGRSWLDRAIRSADGAVVSEGQLARVFDGAGALAEAQGDIDRATELHERAYVLWTEAGDRLGQARSLQNLGIIALHDRGDIARAREFHEAALNLFVAIDDRPGVASSLKNLGDAALSEEAFAEASSYYTRALVIARDLKDTRGIAAGLTSLGALAFFLGDTARAIELYEESLPLWRQLDDKPGLALTMGNLGEALDHAGEMARAAPLYEESLALSRDLDDRQGIAFALSHLGRAARQQGNVDAAARCFVEAAQVARDIGDHARLAESIEGLAGALLDAGEAATAARLFGMAGNLRETAAAPLHSIHIPGYERDLARVRGALGEEPFAKLIAEGASAALDELPLRLPRG
jgi:predicted ATPase/class 3 adenylate cyclase